MDKTNKDKQCYTKHIEERQTIPWPKRTRTNNVIQNTSWYCLIFFDVFCITLFVLVRFGHSIVWRSSMCFVLHCLSLLVLSMVLQCYTKHIEERQTIPWPKPTRINNGMQNTSKNVRQYHGQNQQGQTMLYKTHRRISDNPTFFDVFYITLLFLVGFGHGNVWRSSMCLVLHCLSLLILAMVLSDVLLYKTHRRTSDNTIAKTNKDKQCYTKHIEERQPIPEPKPTRTNNVFFEVFCITLFVLVGFGYGIVWRSSMCFA
jgi:Na+-transporting methylmalonyl-CoA/oxaloacetate decarboxylase gamma subunit